jgi:hypothetical protein
MKKLIGIVVAMVMSLSIAAPAMAVDVDTGVTVTQGGGNIPIVKCKWETPDDADPSHTTLGTQVMPSLQYQVNKPVTIWVVVTDIEDQGNVSQVVADVFHPAGPPENGSIKYHNVELSLAEKFGVGIPAFMDAEAQGLVHYGAGHDYASVLEQLNECFAEVWCATIDLHYHQPAGDYTVVVTAVDTQGNSSNPFTNMFNYFPMCGIETDFTSVSYPDVMISKHVWVPGDTNWGTAGAPTIRNIGNTNAFVDLWQDDMGFGQYASGEYKVEYDARMGPQVDPTDPTRVVYDPFVTTRLPNILPLCNTNKLDFSIHVKYATPGAYNGQMVISCGIAPF